MNQHTYKEGFFDGFPIGLGYLFVSFGFGITAVNKGIKPLIALIISMTNLTSAGQLAGVTIIAAGGTLIEIFLTQFVINLRYSLMGITITQKFDNHFSTRNRLLCSFGLTDEIFSVAMSKDGQITPSYFYGLMTLPYIGWALGTVAGALAGDLLPTNLTTAMGIMMYAMFVAIIIPPMKKDKNVIFAVILATAFSCIFSFIPFFSFISSGFAIIISAILSATIIALIPTNEVKIHE